ncbi:MAG: (Fe-S)-binding protein [Terriglobales bacterium]
MNTAAICEQASHFTTPDRPTWELYARCIHCGLCLNQCPTYRVLGLESDSPRGRIYQVLQVDAGRLAIADSFVLHMDRCLGCRGCETACPSGVQYGRILERARAEIEKNYRRPALHSWLRNYFYRKVLVNPALLARWARLLRFYQRCGVQAVLRATGVLKLVGLDKLETLTPRIDENFFSCGIGSVYPAKGERRARVGFLAGCIANVAFAELNRTTIRVLNENGVEVVVPRGQGCCGALHDHAGYLDDARALARKNIDAFLSDSFDAIINNAAGCGAMLKEYGELLEHDPAYAERAAEFSAKVKDINEYLAALGLRQPRRRLNRRVTYQDSCHLAHGQNVRSAPRELLLATGAELIEMPGADLCCGSAGTYNVTQNKLSMQILDEKMRDVAGTGAEVLATANVGCILQLRAGVARHRLRMKVKHVVELLDECY